MSTFFNTFFSWISRLISLLQGITFPIGSLNVSMWALILGFTALSIVISVFWRGARS